MPSASFYPYTRIAFWCTLFTKTKEGGAVTAARAALGVGMAVIEQSGDELFELIDKIGASDKLMEGHEVLQSALAGYGLDHVVYIAVNLPTEKRASPLVTMTYSADWQKHYAQNDFVDIDPVVRAGIGGILPVDWASLDRSHPTVRRFFGEAQEFKIGSQGLSIPVRGRHGEFALFSVTSDMTGAQWEQLKRRCARDFMLLAYNFHSFALEAEHIELREEYRDKLSYREAESLRWAAMGNQRGTPARSWALVSAR